MRRRLTGTLLWIAVAFGAAESAEAVPTGWYETADAGYVLHAATLDDAGGIPVRVYRRATRRESMCVEARDELRCDGVVVWRYTVTTADAGTVLTVNGEDPRRYQWQSGVYAARTDRDAATVVVTSRGGDIYSVVVTRWQPVLTGHLRSTDEATWSGRLRGADGDPAVAATVTVRRRGDEFSAAVDGGPFSTPTAVSIRRRHSRLLDLHAPELVTMPDIGDVAPDRPSGRPMARRLAPVPRSITIEVFSAPEGYRLVSVAPTGRYAVARRDAEGTAVVLSLVSGSLIAPMMPAPAAEGTVRWSPDGAAVVWETVDGTLTVARPATMTMFNPAQPDGLPLGWELPVTGVPAWVDASRLAVRTNDGRVVLVALPSGDTTTVVRDLPARNPSSPESTAVGLFVDPVGGRIATTPPLLVAAGGGRESRRGELIDLAEALSPGWTPVEWIGGTDRVIVRDAADSLHLIDLGGDSAPDSALIPGGAAGAAAVSPDRRLVAIGHADPRTGERLLSLRRVDDGQPVGPAVTVLRRPATTQTDRERIVWTGPAQVALLSGDGTTLTTVSFGWR